MVHLQVCIVCNVSRVLYNVVSQPLALRLWRAARSRGVLCPISVKEFCLTCQMNVGNTAHSGGERPLSYLEGVADGIVESFTGSHVTSERAEAVRLAFKDVLLVR